MNDKYRLNTVTVSWKMILRRKKRSMYVIVLIAFLTFAVFCGGLLIDGAERGMENTSQRLGADLMAVPQGYDAELESVFLRSEPSSFYFEDAQILNEISKVNGVADVSPQLYLQTLEAACCAVPVQLIVFDAESDFTILPWIEDMYTGEAAYEDGVWIGSLVEAIPGDEIVLYGQNFSVVGRFGETGSGFDSSIFMEKETAQRMIRLSAEMAEMIACKNVDAVSCVMIRISDGYKASDVAAGLRLACPQAQIVETQTMLGSISSNMRLFASTMKVLLACIWIMAILVVSIVFAFSIQMRRQEFGMLRTIGAPKWKLVRLVLLEAGIMSVIGAGIGCFAGVLVVVPFKALIARTMQIPYIIPNTAKIVSFAVISLMIGAFTGPLTGAFSAAKTVREETFLLVKEGGG